MRKRVTNTDLLRSVDESVQTAVNKMVEIINDATAKRSEILNASDKIIKLRFQLQESIRKEALDKIEIEYKQLNLEEKQIKLEALRGLKDPNSTPEQVKTYSRTFTPAMKPDEVDDSILKTG